jgi:hypothetical protein
MPLFLEPWEPWEAIFDERREKRNHDQRRTSPDSIRFYRCLLGNSKIMSLSFFVFSLVCGVPTSFFIVQDGV